jgi:hypothetical protein
MVTKEIDYRYVIAKDLLIAFSLLAATSARGSELKAEVSATDPVACGYPLSTITQFPSSVPVAVKRIIVDTDDVPVLSLDIRFQIRLENIDDLADYFGAGFSARETAARLAELLGTAESLWIPIGDVIVDWPKIPSGACAHPLGDEPGFGDLVARPGLPPCIFVMKDAASGRPIGMTPLPGAEVPVRLWWVDEGI